VRDGLLGSGVDEEEPSFMAIRPLEGSDMLLLLLLLLLLR
jgi:hypothetical protein